MHEAGVDFWTAHGSCTEPTRLGRLTEELVFDVHKMLSVSNDVDIGILD